MNRNAVIRLLIERCPSLTLLRITQSVRAAEGVGTFDWADDHGVGVPEIVDVIIKTYRLPTDTPVDSGVQTYGRPRPVNRNEWL